MQESVSWIGVLNNPQDHLDIAQNFDYENATPEQFRELLIKCAQIFINSGRRIKRDPKTSSILVGAEVGEEGTFHLHFLFCAKRAIKFKSLQKMYPSIHLEPARGHYHECRDYIFKQGTKDNEAKADTMLCTPFEWGEYQVTFSDVSSSGSIFDLIDSQLDEGKTPKEICAQSAKLAFYRNAIETAYSARKDDEIPTIREITTYYHVGESQTGKSYTYVKLREKYETDNVYRIAGEYKNIWDDYNYQKVVIFDEFRGSLIKYSTMLEYLQGYKQILKCRYSNKFADYNEVHITSVIPPEDLYKWDSFQRFDGKEQLFNRIDFIVLHWKDENGFHEYEMPFSEYTNYFDLKKRAGLCQEPTQSAEEEPPDPSLPVLSPDNERVPTTVPDHILESRKAAQNIEEDLNEDWEKYFEIEEPHDYQGNPFISFEFRPGIKTSTRIDFQEFMNDSKEYLPFNLE